MTKLVTIVRIALVASIVATLSVPATAQFASASSRAIYVGNALNVAGITVPQGADVRSNDQAAQGPAATTPAALTTANEPFVLDLTLYDDGFAYGRLLLPRRGQVVAGSGSLQQGSELRLIFDEVSSGPADWQARLAHSAMVSEDPDLLAEVAPGKSSVVASFSGRRDMEFGFEGRLIKGALAFTAEPGSVVNAEFQRFAQYSTWEFGQGRIRAGFTSPHLRRDGQAVNDLLEDGGRERLERFVGEGRRYAADGILGWAWELDEYVTIEGLAGSYLSMLNTIHSYTGGAHPNTFFDSYLFELRPSGVTVLEVDDLFRPDSAWLARLTPLILSDLEAQDAAWVTQGQVEELTLADVATFTLGPTGLTFHFAPYAMGPYVQGAFSVTVDYGQLIGLAPAGGALEQFARGTAVR